MTHVSTSVVIAFQVYTIINNYELFHYYSNPNTNNDINIILIEQICGYLHLIVAQLTTPCNLIVKGIGSEYQSVNINTRMQIYPPNEFQIRRKKLLKSFCELQVIY